MGVAKPSEQAVTRTAKFSAKFGASANEFCKHICVLKDFDVRAETFYCSNAWPLYRV